MGKNSLIYVTLHGAKVFEKEYQTFFFDILSTNSLSEFTYLLGKEIFNSLRPGGIALLRGFLASLRSMKGSCGFDPVTGLPTFDIWPRTR
ncbi:MAG: hypothetical protein K2J18_08160 [Paramuribaculum sp.]|nr:hypothetical protein [Paramuribaculum sp.]